MPLFYVSIWPLRVGKGDTCPLHVLWALKEGAGFSCKGLQ